MNHNTVSALEARRNFGELLNRALYKGEEILIERKGKVVAKIVPASPSKRGRNILSYAGIWATKDVRQIKTAIRTTRRSSSRLLSSL